MHADGSKAKHAHYGKKFNSLLGVALVGAQAQDNASPTMESNNWLPPQARN